MIRYQDTRGGSSERISFLEAALRGTAPGGGLYVPERTPHVPLGRIVALAGRPYAEQAATVMGWFETDLDAGTLERIALMAWDEAFDDPAVAPLRGVAPGIFVLELWHGPTAAFKDLALQALPLFYEEAVRRERSAGGTAHDRLILVATSGDTGKAALEGFADRLGTSVAVCYPADGVSPLQRLQMVTQEGVNVGVWGMAGDFDDCQRAVKALLADEAFARRLAEGAGIRPASANSITWGRVLPQIIYYIMSYAELIGVGTLKEGALLDICVPTGNFGNILAAWYARRMGVPIGRLVCASNENDVLTEFLRTGVYDRSARTLHRTPSPSMDILVSSNLERLLFEVTRDAGRVRRWQESLASGGRFEVDGGTLASIREVFTGVSVEAIRCLTTIRRVYEDHGYLLDPHTAVAWAAAEDTSLPERPMLVVSTAHWAKFAPDVYRALNGIAPGGALPEAAMAGGFEGMLGRIAEFTVDQAVPASLQGLEFRPVRFPAVIEAGTEPLREAVLGWLGL